MDLLQICLNALNPAIQTVDIAYEVIVTDDSDGSAGEDLIKEKYAWAKWIKGPKKGPAANRNKGAGSATGDWLIFIDDDCIPDTGILKNYKDAISRHPFEQAFEGAILPDDWSLMKNDLSECPINTNGDCFWSANVCIKTSLFKQVHGFDTRYLIAAQEDQQMKIDIENATARKIKFLKECVVVHPVRFSTLRKQIDKIPVVSKNFLIYAIKNRRVLGYDTLQSFALSQFKSHFRYSMQSIRLGKKKTFLISLIWLIYGVPLNILNYYRMRSKY